MPAQPKTTQQPRWQSYGYLLLNALVWGASAIIVKPAFAYTSPFRYLLYRYLIAVVLSLPLLWYYGKKVSKKTWPTLLKRVTILELIGTTLCLALLYMGLERTSAIETSLLVSTSPVFIVLAGVIFLRENQEKHEWAGLTLALIGTVLLAAWPWFTGQHQMNGLSALGNTLVIGSNVAAAFYYVWAKKWYKDWPKLLVTTISFYVGAVTFAALSLFELQWSISALISTITIELHQPVVLWAAGYMALFGSIIGLTAYIKDQDGIEASEASLFTYLQPLVYLPLGFLLLKEKLGWHQLFALGLITLGIWLSSWYNRPSLRIRARRRKTV